MEKKAFSPGGAVKTPHMISIGKQIANKCSGLPLASKFLGSLMHSKNKESDWLAITETSIWNTHKGQSEIRPILKLSYDNLSPHLKQCFSYCSIFPRGWKIGRETLIHLWMAEGFLETSSTAGNARSLEDIGEEYFDSLVWSSFLDVVEKNRLHDVITCKLHDLVHDLGRDIIGNRECASVKISELENASDIRRLQLISDDELSPNRCKALKKLKKLRTIVILEPANCDNMTGYTFSSSERLRVLHYSRSADSCLYQVPNSLRHLRYLHLSKLKLINGLLDDDYFFSISKLHNLQTLSLRNCSLVQFLLEKMGSLKNLRFLDISSSDIIELPDSVTNLCNLQKLNLSHCKILTTFPNSVTGLKSLKFLDMSFTPIEELPGFVTNLCDLQTLDVSGCKKLKCLPENVAGFANLRIFNFRDCPLLEALPRDFGALTQLRSLDLRNTVIKVLPEGCENLHNLEYADLYCCETLVHVKNWTKLRNFYYTSNLETPKGLGKLVWLQALTYKVREQDINEPEGDVGVEELENLYSLEMLALVNLQNVKDPVDAERANLKGKQNLRSLYLSWDENIALLRMIGWVLESYDDLKVLEALRPPTSLISLDIFNFMGSDLPTWMRLPSDLPNLAELKLVNCKGIKQLLPASIGQLPRLRFLDLSGMYLWSIDIVGFSSLVRLHLTDMFLLEELGCSYPCLQELRISGCINLREIPSFPLLRVLVLKKLDPKLVFSVGRCQTSLTQLFLENIDGLVYFPVNILQNNVNLEILAITECNHFEGFGVNDDEKDNESYEFHIGSLRILEFIHCPVLKFLPDLRGWSSLKRLLILNCPQVKESLTYDLKSLFFLKELYVDYIQRDEQRGDPAVAEELINLTK